MVKPFVKPCFHRRRVGPRGTGIGTVTPAQLAARYELPRLGAGVLRPIAVVELGGGFKVENTTAAFAAWGLPAPTIQAIGVGGAGNSPGDDADAEVELDIQIAAAIYSYMTGQAARIFAVFGPNSDTGFPAAIRAAVDAVGSGGVVSISWGCYDHETEVLTSDGWRYFSDIAGDELIATLNTSTGVLEYQRPTKVHKYPYKGQLHSYRGRCTDLLVTPNHNMYVRRGHREAAALVPSDEVFGNNWCYVPKTALWVGEEIENVQVAGRTVNADLYLEFLGYFLSEGHASIGTTHHKPRVFVRSRSRLVGRRRQANGTYAASDAGDGREVVQSVYTARGFEEETHAVGISQTKSDLNIRLIQECLDRLPFRFTRRKGAWRCRDKELCQSLVGFGKSVEKHVPAWVKNLCPRQLKIFYDALMLGDGTRNEKGKQAYYTSSRRLADDVQEILLKLGFVGSIKSVNRVGRVNAKGVTRHVEYRVNIKEKYKTERLTEHSLVDYDGFVYCLTVPNHVMFVRRNGWPAWCGNSPEDQWSVASVKAMEAVFAYAAGKGVNVTAASGDNDSGDGERGNHVDYPASSPQVIGCGGTTLRPSDEAVWNDGQSGTGGGFSRGFKRPPWQPAVGSQLMRGVPDVAGDADPQTGYQVWVDGAPTIIGGTSAVAPLWAGILAALGGRTSLPAPILPLLYQHPEAFRDVTVGNNGGYPAAAGWDACTGLGTPNGAKLLAALVGDVLPPPPPPPGGAGTITLNLDTHVATVPAGWSVSAASGTTPRLAEWQDLSGLQAVTGK